MDPDRKDVGYDIHNAQQSLTLSGTNGFIYDELDDDYIRVIDIVPEAKSRNGELTIRFRKTALRSPEPYIALSYTWVKTLADGRHLSKVLKVDGAMLRVTANLYTALVRLRKIFDRSDEGPVERVGPLEESTMAVRRPLWVDALSINQGDHRELSRQVKHMGEIYRRSDQLLVWLGEQYANHDFRPSTARLGSQDRLAVQQMLRSPWFTRRWIIQEYYMKLSDVWPQLSLSRGISLLLRESISPAFNFSECVNRFSLDLANRSPLLTISSANRGSVSLLDNLSHCCEAECSDPRDRISSLLSITSDGAGITIDYSKDTVHVYVDVAQHLIRTTPTTAALQRLFLIALGQQPFQEHKDLQGRWPSWVPDWRVRYVHHEVPPTQRVDEADLLQPHGARTTTVYDPEHLPLHALVLNVVILRQALIYHSFPNDNWLGRYKKSTYMHPAGPDAAFGLVTPGTGVFCYIPNSTCIFHILPTSSLEAGDPIPRRFSLQYCIDRFTVLRWRKERLECYDSYVKSRAPRWLTVPEELAGTLHEIEIV